MAMQAFAARVHKDGGVLRILTSAFGPLVLLDMP